MPPLPDCCAPVSSCSFPQSRSALFPFPIPDLLYFTSPILDLLYFFSRSVLVGPCLIFNTCCHFQQMASQNLISASATASASVGSVSRESEKQPTLRLHFGIISPFWRGLNLVEAMLYGDANIVHCKRAVATLELKLICCKSLRWGLLSAFMFY